MSERDLILQHMLKLVPFDGWTEHALTQAFKQCGVDKNKAADVFPGGLAECMDYFFHQEDEALANAFPEGSLKAMRVPERIETLLLWRLHHLLPHREAVRRAVAERALPWNMLHTSQALYRTIDKMWRIAGDTSIDFSFYTKRMTLAAIYSSTLLYWLGDTSEHQENTKEFLKRRLMNVAEFGRWKKDCKAALQKAFSW